MAGDEGTDAGDGVHRLVDMVVEEVSLVDRAANQRRFLLVKRETDMPDEGALGGESPGEGSGGGRGPASTETIAATIEALTALTELIAGTATKAFPPPKKPGKAGEGDAAPDDGEDDDEEDPAAAAQRRKAAESMAALLGQVKAALARLQAAAAAPAQKRAPDSDPIVPRLDAIGASLAKIESQLKEQDGRLGKVEKNVGLPASRTPDGGGASGDDDNDVSWPLDLNAPMDRASVDKSISFHGDQGGAR